MLMLGAEENLFQCSKNINVLIRAFIQTQVGLQRRCDGLRERALSQNY